MKLIVTLLWLIAEAHSEDQQQEKSGYDYVNPLIGTINGG